MVVVEIDLDESAGTLDWRAYAKRPEIPAEIIHPPIQQRETVHPHPQRRDDSSGSDTDCEGSSRQQNKGPKRGIFDDIISKWSGLSSNSFEGNEVYI
jgi:hypothetical protein